MYALKLLNMSQTIHTDKHSYTQLYTWSPDHSFSYRNWEMNRPPDPSRVEEIVSKLRPNQLMNGTIHVWKYPTDTIWNVYDGIHRLQAMEKYSRQTGNSIQCIIRFKTPLQIKDIYEEFNTLNRSVPVPEIYLRAPDEPKKTICMRISTQLYTEYKAFHKTSRRPRRPHFNRDRLMDDLTDLEIDFSMENMEKRLYTTLIELNTGYAKRISWDRLRLEESGNGNDRERQILEKCESMNFFLFNVEWSELKQKVEQVLTNS